MLAPRGSAAGSAQSSPDQLADAEAPAETAGETVGAGGATEPTADAVGDGGCEVRWPAGNARGCAAALQPARVNAATPRRIRPWRMRPPSTSDRPILWRGRLKGQVPSGCNDRSRLAPSRAGTIAKGRLGLREAVRGAICQLGVAARADWWEDAGDMIQAFGIDLVRRVTKLTRRAD